MNKQELIAKIAKDTGGSKATAGKALASMIDGITKALKKGGSVGLVGFGIASAIGGIAQNQGELFAARGLQGAFAALMAPAALSLVTITFTEPRERARAFAVYGGISGGGAALGLILGGVLTEYASWRWTLLVNTPIAIATASSSVRSRGGTALPASSR